MKKIKYLFFILLSVLILPLGVFADEDEDVVESVEEASNEVVVYFFRGEGCSHCAEAEAWFESIEEEYGDKFQIQDYETWYNEDNAKLMTQVAAARGEEDSATGVPYIIIGDQSWIGFDQAYSTEIISKIEEEYAKTPEERYNIMNHLDSTAKEEVKTESNDVLKLIVILVVGFGVGFGIYKARKAAE